MSKIEIRKINRAELISLQTIGRQTFSETFSAENTEENLEKYLEEGFSEEKLLKELDDTNAEFYFACSQNEIIGYLKVNVGASQTELQDHKALEIERIYVLKAYHGKGIGALLFDRAIEIARQRQASYVWLGVWEKNPRAISFYKKNGFVEFDRHIFKLGDDVQTDIMMKLILKES